MRVLIAEDNRTVAETLADMIGAAHHEVVETVGSGLQAIHAYDRVKPDVVVMDYMMSGLNGITACRNIVAKDPEARVVLVSAALTPGDPVTAGCGAMAVLQKPVDLGQLQQVLDDLPARAAA